MKKKIPILENEKDFINSIFFKNQKLNFTENLIQKNDNRMMQLFFIQNKILKEESNLERIRE